MYSIHAHKGSHSCLGGVTYALGANDWGVTGAWESFVPLTPVLLYSSESEKSFHGKSANLQPFAEIRDQEADSLPPASPPIELLPGLNSSVCKSTEVYIFLLL